MRHLAFQLPVGADKDVNDQHDFVQVGGQGHNNILYVALTPLLLGMGSVKKNVMVQ